jgi:hypothetical protein
MPQSQITSGCRAASVSKKNRNIDRRSSSEVTIGWQQLKILLIERAPSSFNYNFNANVLRTIIVEVSELKTSSQGHRAVPGRFVLDRAIVFDTKKHRPI